MAAHHNHWIRKAARLRIYVRDRYRCLWCLVELTVDNATLDHFLARSAGGSNAAGNVFTSCRDCNNARGKKPALSFAIQTRNSEALDRIIDHLEIPVKGEQGKRNDLLRKAAE